MQRGIQNEQIELVKGKAHAEVVRAQYRRQMGFVFVFWKDDDAAKNKRGGPTKRIPPNRGKHPPSRFGIPGERLTELISDTKRICDA